jgi:hypothetical protein
MSHLWGPQGSCPSWGARGDRVRAAPAGGPGVRPHGSTSGVDGMLDGDFFRSTDMPPRQATPSRNTARRVIEEDRVMDKPSCPPNAERKVTRPCVRRRRSRRKSWSRHLRCRLVLMTVLQATDATIKVADHAVKLWQFIGNLVR